MQPRYQSPYQPAQSSLLVDGPSTPSGQALIPANASSIPHAHPSLGQTHHSRSALFPRTPTLPLNQPLPWLWQCHRCRHTYPLGATRRCLDDGHTFCSGEAHDTKNLMDMWNRRYMRRTKACNSEFDYEGWRTHIKWKNTVKPALKLSASSHDCWRDCTYPSECKWSKQVTPVTAKSEEMDVEDVPRVGVKRAASLASMDVDDDSGYGSDDESESSCQTCEDAAGRMDVDDEGYVEGLSGRFGTFGI